MTRFPSKAYASVRGHAAIAISLLALFIALGGTAGAVNTVRSGDIVDGQVMNRDLGTNSVQGNKTFGFASGSLTTFKLTSDCAQANIWSQCGAITIQVPPGHYYIITVSSTISADPGFNTIHALYCAATTGPTCIIDGPDYATFWARGVGPASQSAENIFGPGTYNFSTAIKTPVAFLADTAAHTTTTVRWFDWVQESAN